MTYVNSVKSIPSDIILKVGNTFTGTYVEVLSEDAENRELSWKSSDDSIAEVDEGGVITAKYPGTAMITATNILSGNNTQIAVTVVLKPMTD